MGRVALHGAQRMPILATLIGRSCISGLTTMMRTPAKLTGEIDFVETPENFQSLNDLLKRVRKSL